MPETPNGVVEAWLAQFDEALRSHNTDGVLELFDDDSYWRDFVAFTDRRLIALNVHDAVMRLVESIAAEVEGTPVSLFVISPGLVATDMTQFPEAFLAHYPDWRDLAHRQGIPPERAAELALSLASGRYDALSGRFLRTTTDLDVAVAAARAEEPGTLRIVPFSSE